MFNHLRRCADAHNPNHKRWKQRERPAVRKEMRVPIADGDSDTGVLYVKSKAQTRL